jgi:hypothetical protein
MGSGISKETANLPFVYAKSRSKSNRQNNTNNNELEDSNRDENGANGNRNSNVEGNDVTAADNPALNQQDPSTADEDDDNTPPTTPPPPHRISATIATTSSQITSNNSNPDMITVAQASGPSNAASRPSRRRSSSAGLSHDAESALPSAASTTNQTNHDNSSRLPWRSSSLVHPDLSGSLAVLDVNGQSSHSPTSASPSPLTEDAFPDIMERAAHFVHDPVALDGYLDALKLDRMLIAKKCTDSELRRNKGLKVIRFSQLTSLQTIGLCSGRLEYVSPNIGLLDMTTTLQL